MARQPAISFSLSLQVPFNRAGGRTSNVRQEIEEDEMPHKATMKTGYYFLFAAAVLMLQGCKGDRAASSAQDNKSANAEEKHPLIDATRLNMEQPLVHADNLELIYRRAIYDFADFEVKNASAVTPVRSWMLGQMWEDVLICSDRGIEDMLHLKPGQFAGVDFVTPLGDRLISAEPLDSAKGSRTVIGLYSIWHSKSRMRVQAVLGFSNIIGESWTFLYDVDRQGGMRLRKSENIGCDFPEGWIDDPRL